MQPGDVKATYANTNLLRMKLTLNQTLIGIKKFINWYISYYRN